MTKQNEVIPPHEKEDCVWTGCPFHPPTTVPPEGPENTRARKLMTYDDIQMFMHCDQCMKELPPDVAPADYASFEVGIAKNRKLVIYCKRHKKIAGEFTLKNPPPNTCDAPGCDCHAEFEEDPRKKLEELWMNMLAAEARLHGGIPHLTKEELDFREALAEFLFEVHGN